jgi:hypothetical protein
LSGSRSYLLREGRAFALGPRDFAASEAHGVRALPLRPTAHVPLDVAWTEPPSPAARTVMSEVRSLVREGSQSARPTAARTGGRRRSGGDG